MSSHKQHNCLLSQNHCDFDFTSFIACDHCSAVLSSCIIMTGHAKCFECTCHDCLCVSISLDFWIVLTFTEIWTQGDYEWLCETGWASFQAECKGSSPFQDFETEWVLHSHQSSLCCFKLSNDNNRTEDEENLWFF
jgi:hypothetical protein